MAHTLFSNTIFDSELFMEYLMELSPNPDALTEAGILRKDAQLESRISEGSELVSVPSFKPLTGASQNYAGEDITVNSISSVKQTAIIIGRANAWGSQDLAAELATKDPMRAIAESVVKYWKEERQRILIKVLNGMFAAANLTNHVTDISIADGNNATASNLFGSDLIIDAAQKAIGDNGGKITGVSVHSKVYARMQKLNLIQYEKLSNQNTLVPFFLGKVVIVDDTHPVVAGGTSGFKYTSFLYGQNTIGTAEGKVKVPSEIERQALISGGREHLVNRARFVYHPYGMQWTDNTRATTSPTDAELETAANWTRVYEEKNIPIIKVVTNG